MTEDWDPRFLARSPMFEPLRIHGGALNMPQWPSPGDLERLLAQCDAVPVTGSGARLSFVPQSRKAQIFEEKYEPRIFLKGEVQVRESNWHDLLNALVWLTFPRAKAALNARHYRALLAQQAQGARNRGPEQDAITLFDEGGVIVAAREPELLQLLQSCEWKALFWRSRARVMVDMRFYLFGHALYEKALNPFTGITARGLLFEVDAGFFRAPLAAQIQSLDAVTGGRLADMQAFRSPAELTPVPILGVPGWCADNAVESYYDNRDYFRARKAAARRR